jgi:hypothetical protein
MLFRGLAMPEPSTPCDPAEWSRASILPEPDRIDTLDDVLHEAALEELETALKQRPQKSVVRLVVKVANLGIVRAAEAGLLPSGIGGAKSDEGNARLIAEIIEAPNAKLHAQCIDFVFGYGIMMGLSQTAIAELHPPMTKSNVSKICVGIRKRYNVKPSRGMKSVDACESYRLRQTGRRAKPTRENWRLAGELKQAFYGLAEAA